ncbi:copper resistance protein CopC [Acidisoma cellulosilytica]|uniref:Copper resistance protein CopC n=1 Tax=Acidisoma cellulosilyticum TaxID=2802395 RepID=A0A963Z862_9PROT|nr:copper resistance protein CopC [Acidisoma cellulosilyticum]MCB8883835.1 copper resistance protein CopC [Acidisoma cellulosilyticum]
MNIRILAAAFVATIGFSTGAFAHAYPQTESPSKGSTVTTAPTALWIEFDDELEPKFTGVTVTDSMGMRMDDGKAAVSPTDAHHLSIGLKPLAPGQYTVTWHATDTDTHKTHGTYTFTVGQ